MQIVIDIPDEDYQRINSKEKIITLSCNIADAVKNGTPLPKGHGRLIDVDIFKKDLSENYVFYGFSYLLNDFYKALDEQQTIIEADPESEDKG